MNKKAVQFPELVHTRYAYERLKQCVRCGAYSSLGLETCLSCEAEHSLRPVTDIARTVLRNGKLRDALLLGASGLAGFVFARSVLQMSVSLTAGLLLVGVYVWLCKRYAQEREQHTLLELLKQESAQVRDGMLLDAENAAGDLKSEDELSAYLKLREIGHFLKGDQIKLLKIYCLNRFILRRDMDLELGTLIPEAFDPDFVRYVNEICKVKPELVRRDMLDYARKYRGDIEALAIGPQTMAQLAGAALRVKEYVVQYPDLIADHVGALSRDRLLRLCRLLQDIPASRRSARLYDKAMDEAERMYGNDAEFEPILGKDANFT
ncbi:hypothetical protein PAESOLCIP111_05012 [Paenibacillus solanacearum]|uniref:Uncharacterized protein n=1 Tax=Paenibacillus solanacearum TaxID=2048548 RepID=A0A916K8C9_9BACL|nr:hypothetical protein [Paenibacillus solanacearum]CAG7645746.1 hypothetical protein PAESOLCIP111_05012 [Paenibacillus solanacearum]